MVEAGIDACIQTVVQFQNFVRGFCAGRGAGTATMDIKLNQELESVEQDPLLLVFLDLKKAYNNLDHGQILQKLGGYGSV